MGYYIQGPPVGKAGFIVSQYGGKLLPSCPAWEDIPDDKALVLVVLNGVFDAAAFCYSEQEMAEFMDRADPRPRQYLLMGLQLAKALSGYDR